MESLEEKINQLPPELQKEVLDFIDVLLQKAKRPEGEPLGLKEVKIHFDGASEGNPGPSGAGWVISVDDDVLEGSEYLGIKTSNQAEYLALIRALEEVSRTLTPENVSVSILGDSQLIIRHLKGEYQVRSDRLRPLYRQTMDLLGKLNGWHCEWVNRAQNRRADELSKIAIRERERNSS